MILDKRKENKQ